jgi:hypothetical protein
MDYLHVFKEEKEDNPSQHLVTFHQCMDQLGILHEDVLMKMFMYSLKGDAREWYFSLPASSICSLRDFHVAFNKHCKRYYSADILLEDCCEQFESCNQQTVECFSCDELYEDLVEKEIKEELVLVEEISNSSMQEELETKKKSDIEDDSLDETNDDEPLNNPHVHSDGVVEDHEQVVLLSSGNVEQQIQDFIKSENDFLKPEEEEINNGESSFSSYGSHGDSQLIPYAFIKTKNMQKKFSHEEKIVQDQFSYEDQTEVCIIDYQLRFGFHAFHDPVAAYLEDFVHEIFLPQFGCKFRVQFYDELLIRFQVFILKKYMQRFQLLSQLLEWLDWKFVYT